MPILTLLTDFGTADYYVAAVKGTVLRLAPGTTLVDVSHQVPPGDVESAAFLLAAAAPSFPDGSVHLAVVDPGVGSGRRILAARTASALFLAPDNGLLGPVLDAALEVRAVERSDLFLPAPGATFHGRDRFALVAAWLLRGGDLSELGPAVSDPVRLPAAAPRRGPGGICGRVIHVDRYGNLVTDLPAAWLPAGPCAVEVGGKAVNNPLVTRLVTHYAEIPAGEAAVLVGSLGTLELSMNGEDLARRWSVARGARVELRWNES
jgi:S-adenosyl-L-methionine hydrolase (adenosine-forming)